MKFKYLITFIFLLFCGNTFAQYYPGQKVNAYYFTGSLSVGQEEKNLIADSSAWFQMGADTTTKGFLLPRGFLDSFTATTKQGLFVYSLEDSTLYHFDGTDRVRYVTFKDTARNKRIPSRNYVDSLFESTSGTHAELMRYDDSGTYYTTKYGVDTAKNNIRNTINAHGLQAVTDVDSITTGQMTVGKMIINSPLDGGSPDAGLRFDRVIEDATTNAGHTIQVHDSFKRDGTGGFATFDDIHVMQGSNNDHTVGLQIRYTINEGGTMNDAWSIWAKNTINTGTLTNYKNIELWDMQGAGTVVNNYGLYIQTPTKGTTLNRAIYVQGGKSYFGGDISTNGSMSINKTDVTPSATLDVNGNILFLDDLSSVSNAFDWDEGLACLGLGQTPNSAYSLYTNKGVRINGAALLGQSTGSYNVAYINGAGGNFGTIMRPSANKWALGWDSNIGDTRLGTSVITWTPSYVGILNTAPDHALDVTGDIELSGEILLGTIKVLKGSGSPESVVTAPVGSIYLRTDGGASTTLYVKESGTGNTGWIAK